GAGKARGGAGGDKTQNKHRGAEGEKKGDHKLEEEARTAFHRHEIRPRPEREREQDQRHHHPRQQDRRKALLDRGAGRRQIARQCPDQVVSLHGLAPNLTDSAASPRCRATRTAPSLIFTLAAVSRMDAPSSEIARTTLCWRSGRL